MNRLRDWRWVIGQSAALTFGAMVIVLNWQIAPAAGDMTLPQSDLTGYSDADLRDFSVALGPDLLATYRGILLYMDTAFILSFACFVVLMVWPMGRIVAIAPAVLFALADLGEDQLLLRRVLSPEAIPGEVSSLAWYFTVTKSALFVLCLALAAWSFWRDRRLSDRANG
ncbi:hypothetical protein ACXYMO_14865 [Arenibacterium sp. CAU 1754]